MYVAKNVVKRFDIEGWNATGEGWNATGLVLFFFFPPFLKSKGRTGGAVRVTYTVELKVDKAFASIMAS